MLRRRHSTRVVLVGDIGGVSTAHVGDEAMFEADLALVRRLVRRAACIAVSGDPEHTGATYGVEAVGHDGATAAAAKADLLVVTGGGNLNSSWPEHLGLRLDLARSTVATGGAVVLLGQQLGPNLTDDDADDLRELLGHAAFVGVRDAASASVARRLGVADDVLVEQLDDAWSCGIGVDPGPSFDVGRAPYVAVTLHPDARLVSADAIATVAQQLGEIARETDAAVVLLPHCSALRGPRGTSDEAVAAALAMRLSAAGVPHTSLPVLAPSVVAAITRSSSLVLSTRYHPLVFALSGCVPALGIWASEYVRSKQHGALAVAGLEQWMVELDELFDRGMVAPACELWDRRAEIGTWLSTMSPMLAARVRERDQRLAERLQAVGVDVDPPPREPPATRDRTPSGSPPEPSGRWQRFAATSPAATQPTTVVDELRLEIRSDHVALTARVRSRGESTEVRLRVHDPALSDRIDGSATPFLPCALLLAASTGTDLVIDGPVDSSALDAVEAVTTLYRDWWGYRPPEVDATGVVRDRAPAPGVGLWYSRGVDSTDTLLRSLQGDLSQDEESFTVTHLLGLDSIDEGFRSRAGPQIWSDTVDAAAAVGLPLVRVTTDFRKILDQSAGWKTSHGTLFAGFSLLIGPLVGAVLISSSAIGDRPRPLGSHPMLDPLFSTTSTRILNVGRYPRSQKIRRIAASDGALDVLKVCWAVDTTRNCGRCAKCLATMTALQSVGALDRCDRFDAPLSVDAVRAVARGDPVGIGTDTTRDAVTVAESLDPELFAAWQEVEARVRAAAPPPLSQE